MAARKGRRGRASERQDSGQAPAGGSPGIGIDLVSVRRLERDMDRWGARFRDRIFTPDEIAFCQSRRNSMQSYAARLAAKEALLKALGIGLGPGMRWRDIETVVLPAGRPDLLCHGAVGSIVRGRSVLVSLSHTDEYAAAVVLIL